MSMYTPPRQGMTTTIHHPLGMWCACVSVLLPLVAVAFLALAQPTWIAAPDIVYWTMFGGGVIGFILGGVGVSTTGRRVDSMVLTPAILGSC